MATSEALSWDREALDRFREAHPDFSTVQSIARVKSADEFAVRFADDRAFPGGDRQARRVHNVAKTVAASTAMVWRSLQEMAAPGTARFQNVPTEFLAHQKAAASYPALFGGVSNVADDHGRSVYSEGAYFVDLMRFVQEHLTSAKVPSGLNLVDRRPDLMALRLDEETAYTFVPYIDLVIEALESIIVSDASKTGAAQLGGIEEAPPPKPADPYSVLAAAKFPPTLPFNGPLAEIRAYLGKMKTSLREIYETLKSTATPIERRALLSETLQLSGPSELTRLTTPQGDARRLGPLFGGASVQDLSSVPHFLQATGLSHDELLDLVVRGMTPGQVNAGLTKLFFINQADDGLGPLRIVQSIARIVPYIPEGEKPKPNQNLPSIVEVLENLSNAKLDRVYRFVRLSKKLGWDFTTLDRVLRSLAKPPFTPEPILQLDGVSDFLEASNLSGLDNLTNFTIEAWVCPGEVNRVNPIFAKGRFLDNEPSRTDLLFWIDTTGHLAFSHGAWGASLVYNRSSGPIPGGEFTKVGVSFDASNHVPGVEDSRPTVTFFINGRLDLTLLIDQKPPPKAGELQQTIDNIDQTPGTKPGELQQTIDNRVPAAHVSTPASQPSDAFVGRDLDEHFFQGLIKDVRVWRIPLSESLVSGSLFKQLTGIEEGLAAYWPLTETVGTELPDLGGGKPLEMGGPSLLFAQPVWVTRDLVLDPLPEILKPPGVQFDGKHQFMAVRGAKGLQTGQLTLEAWVTLDAKGPAPLVCFASRGSPEPELLYWGVDDDGHVVLRMTSGFRTQSLALVARGRFASNSSTATCQLPFICIRYLCSRSSSVC